MNDAVKINGYISKDESAYPVKYLLVLAEEIEMECDADLATRRERFYTIGMMEECGRIVREYLIEGAF